MGYPPRTNVVDDSVAKVTGPIPIIDWGLNVHGEILFLDVTVPSVYRVAVMHW